jgi:hypothetical protein
VLLLAIAAALFEQFWLLPQMKSLLARIPDFSAANAGHPLRPVFAQLHRVSLYFNLGFLVAGLGLLLLAPPHIED